MFFKLPPAAFQRQDETNDAIFYRFPRLVQHIDDGAIAAVTALYRDWLPANGAVLDLMSSWISHLPDDVEYERVTALGMNQQELAANPRATDYKVHDLNQSPQLPYATNEFDAATICVSIDYLTQPVAVLAELSRVINAEGPLLITFSNRCFATKAVAVWLQLSGQARGQLVAHWLDLAGGFTGAELVDLSPTSGDPLFAVITRAR
ncbi:MAG: methyltransferase domain-containing protein [Immundisolibacteraceae bacterium]|nr:methyltransferase domain-containing protein [Immundisolibacteraceae bacterium]